MNTITHEQALARVRASLQRKKEVTARLEKEMKQQYEASTGKTASHFFVL